MVILWELSRLMFTNDYLITSIDYNSFGVFRWCLRLGTVSAAARFDDVNFLFDIEYLLSFTGCLEPGRRCILNPTDERLVAENNQNQY